MGRYLKEYSFYHLFILWDRPDRSGLSLLWYRSCSVQVRCTWDLSYGSGRLYWHLPDRIAVHSTVTSISFIAFQPVQIRRKELMAIFTGAGVAIVTPMHENGDVNYEKIKWDSGRADRRRHRCHHYLRNHRRIIHTDTWGTSGCDPLYRWKSGKENPG